MKYLIVGAGGTGGLIGGYLARKNYDVTLVARGEHPAAIQEKGLTIATYGEAPFTLRKIKALAQAEVAGTYDVVFICVKAYSIDGIIPLVEKVCHSGTVVIPILNAMYVGDKLRAALPGTTVLDGCIYITGYVAQPGEIAQNTRIFKIVYGPADDSPLPSDVLNAMQEDLRSSGIGVQYTSNIRGEIFKKISFTSAFATTSAYHDLKAEDLQQEGLYRELFTQLLKELQHIAEAARLGITSDIVSDNLAILDSLSGDFTASIQKDMALGRPDEREELIFDVVRMADRYKVEAPNYTRIASHFGYR